jgi:sugar/nucleoside kinase (ribokinase family)
MVTDPANPPRGAFLGLTTFDVVQVVDSPVSPNAKLRSTAVFQSAGGPAANAAVSFAALGGKAHLVSSIGFGPLASAATDDLRTWGVEVIDLSSGDLSAEVPLSSTAIHSGTGDRCVVSANDASRVIDEGRCPNLPEALDVALVDGHYAAAVTRLVRALPQAVPVVMDAGSWKEQAKPLLSLAAAVICSADFAPPGVAPTDVTRYLLDLGASFAAISRGADDVLWRTPDAQGSIRPPVCAAVDTLGAGDILHGSFAYFVSRRAKLGEVRSSDGWVASLEQAVRIASLSCQFYGTRAWTAEVKLT